MVKQLFEELSRLPQVEAIALGGSRAGTNYDEKSDYDVYLYCTGPVEEPVRREILSRYCSYMELGNHYWELEDNVILRSGVDMDILYRNLLDFTADVASVVEGCQARNGYTTCMWHNLITCKIVYDPEGKLAAAKERFTVPYPARLKQNIITQNRNLLSGTMPAYDGQIRKAVNRGDLVSINHRTAAFLESYFDVILALNEVTHPGEKRLIKLCKLNCPKLPADFEENLTHLLRDLFAAPEAVADDLAAIVAELDKIL